MKLVRTPIWAYDADFFDKHKICVDNFLIVPLSKDSFFFVKDLNANIALANNAMMDVYGENMISKHTCDITSGKLGEEFLEDDYVVFKGKAQINKNELSLCSGSKGLTWRCTTKYPFYGQKGEIIGLVGISRLVGNYTEDDSLKELLIYLNDNLSEKLTIKKLAQVAKMSVSSLERKFNERFSITPMGYVNILRVNKAVNLLQSSKKNISEIASESGFYDQSYLCKILKNAINVSPKQIRSEFTEK